MLINALQTTLAFAPAPEDLDEVFFDANIALTAPIDRHMAASRPALTWLDLTAARVNWGALKLSAKGGFATDAAGFAEGNAVKTLFSRPGFSLTHAWFKSGFPLPLHTHNADCLYYIVAGTLQLGTETLGAGDGFFIGAGKAYRYTPGPEGVEVLEFRSEENFDIKFMAKTLPAWARITDVIKERRPAWATETPPSAAR